MSSDGDVFSIDGVDIRRIKSQDLRRQIGVVLQEPFLFPGTIARQYRLCQAPTRPPNEIMRAAKAANCHDFVMKLRRTATTLSVGERGAAPVRRRASAPEHRARHPARPAHPDFGRGDSQRGYRDRAADPGSDFASDYQPHHVRHRAPIEYAAKRQPPGRDEGRQNGGTRNSTRS